MNVVAAVLLAAVLGSLYFRVVHAPFLFDDEITVETNGSLRQLWPLLGDAKHRGPLNPAPQLPTAGRPVVNFSFAFNYTWSGLNPAGFRLVNLIIHFLSAMLLMLIVRRTLRLPCFEGRFAAAAGPLSLIVALLWAVHPLQTEPVAYVTQRTELLVAFFFLSTIYYALRYWDASPLPLPLGEGRSEGNAASRRRRNLWLALAVLASAAGMGSKETMVTVPAVVLLYDWTFVGRSLRRIARDSWPLYAGLIATWLLLLYLNIDAPRSASTGFLESFSPWAWWSTQAKIFWMYLKLAVWPYPLVIHYEFPYLDTWQAAWPWVLPTVLLLAVTLVLLWRQSPIGFVAASVMVILSPTSIVPILSEIAAERRMYLPLASLIALAIVDGYSLAQNFFNRRADNRLVDVRRPLVAVGSVALALAVAGCLISARRLDAYAAVTPLWEDAVIHQPDNYTVNYNLAGCLITDDHWDEALELLRHTVQTWPDRWRGHLLLAETLSRLGRNEEAIPSFEKVVELKPESKDAQIGLGIALSDSGRYADAFAHFEEASQLDPSDIQPQFLWGLALSKAGLPAEAVEHYQQALKIDDKSAEVHNNLGVAYVKLGRKLDAEAEFRQAVELKPDYVDAQNNLARAHDQSGDLQDAIARYEEVLRLQPDNFETHSKLADAYVRANQPAKAIAVAEKAAELARSAGQDTAAAQIQNWLREYRAQQASPAAPSAATSSPVRQALPKAESSSH